MFNSPNLSYTSIAKMRLKQTETKQTQIILTVAFPSSILYYTLFPYRTTALYPFGSKLWGTIYAPSSPSFKTPKSSNGMQFVCEARALSVTRSSTSLLHRHGFGPIPAGTRANEPASWVCEAASLTHCRWMEPRHLIRTCHPSPPPTPPSSPRKRPDPCSTSESPREHRPSTQTASERFLRWDWAATNRWAAACRSCLSPLPRGSTGSTSGHLRRTCPQDARCRRWARLRGALPRRPTRGEDASCTARCRFERDARGSRWDVLESGEKEECVWFTRRCRFLVGWYFPIRLITRSEFTMLARIDFSSRGWNGMESDSLYQHRQTVSYNEIHHPSHDVESSRSLLRSYGSNPINKQNTIHIQNFHTNYF